MDKIKPVTLFLSPKPILQAKKVERHHLRGESLSLAEDEQQSKLPATPAVSAGAEALGLGASGSEINRDILTRSRMFDILSISSID